MIATTGLLPYQYGLTLSKTYSGSTTELWFSNHSQKVLYIQNEDRDEEEEADISIDKMSKVRETDQQKVAKRRKNNQREQRKVRTRLLGISSMALSSSKQLCSS